MARVVAESTQAIAVCDANTVSRTLIYINSEFERLTGFSRTASYGHSLSQLLRPPGGQFEWERVEAALAGDLPWRRALPSARKDGTVFWADLHVYPLKHDGVISHWVVVITDVTDHLELHEALRQSEAQHRLIAENAKDLITVHRPDGRCVYASPSSRSLLGYEPAQLAGKPFRLILHHAERAQARRIFENHFSGLTESTFVHRVRRKDGTYLWAETSSKTRREPGSQRPLEIVSLTRDFSKRHQDEERLRSMHKLLDAVYEAVPIGLCLLDSAGLIVQCNRSFARAFELQPLAVAGRSAEALLPPLALSRATTTQQVPCECECTDAHGARFPAELTVVAFEPGAGAQRLVALRDLRERKKIEARQPEINQLESLGTLAGGIAHDFNNILAIILAYASLLREATGDPARIVHYADTIIDAGQRGADVVHQLQLFASVHDAEAASIDAHQIIEKNLFKSSANRRESIQIVKAFDAADSTLVADPVQLAQALEKLIDNACEAMPTGGTLTLRTSELQQAAWGPAGVAEPKNFLRISVEDTGVGMDAATRVRMFEPFFFRGNKADAIGVGLAVVYGIMRAHRGSIEVDSAPGHGTRVHLLFPRTEVPALGVTQPPFAPASAAAVPRRAILLVEDEHDIGTLWLELLAGSGWRVYWARDGREAIELFRAHRTEIALVFTDIILPSLDGWQVADAVRKKDPTMPLLIASGAFARNDRNRGYAQPVVYLPKPYVPSKVLQQINELVSR